MRTFLLILPILTSLYGAAVAGPLPTVGETDVVENLMDFRVTRGNTWKDPQTDQPLYRLNHKGEFVQAACDSDITFTTPTTPFNTGTIMRGYLADSTTFPQASMRSAPLINLVGDPNWNRLLTLAKNYRVSQNRIARDCFGRELFEASLGARKTAADIRDITDIPTLIAALEPAIRAGCAPAAAPAPIVHTASVLANYEAFLVYRTRQMVMHLEPRTSEQLCRFAEGTLVPAAKDDDVLPDLSNVTILLTAAMMPAAGGAPVMPVVINLAPVFADANLNRLYQLVEDSRRGQGRLLADAIGRPLYKASLGSRVQIVNMQDIIDTSSLLTAVLSFFAENLRPVVPMCACGSHCAAH